MAAMVPLTALAWPGPSGRVYPERNDDLAWENGLVAFRAYGPATQRNGERAFGYDLFLKYPDKGPVLERLYAAQTSARNWAVVDSLRKTDPDRAREFERSFTYHVDHGYGMDSASGLTGSPHTGKPSMAPTDRRMTEDGNRLPPKL